jgi:hypothetical protein
MTMNQMGGPQGPTHSSGTAATRTGGVAQPFSPYAATPEREITAVQGQAPGLAQPDIAANAPEPAPSVTVPDDNARLADILGGEDATVIHQSQGRGPRLVVIGDLVMGKRKGDVVWASDLVGLDLYLRAEGVRADGTEVPAAERDEARRTVRRMLARFVHLKAVREANRKEAQYTRVVFQEGEQALAAALGATQTRELQLEEEVARLRALLSNKDVTGGEQTAPEGGERGAQSPLGPGGPPSTASPTTGIQEAQSYSPPANTPTESTGTATGPGDLDPTGPGGTPPGGGRVPF